MDTIRTLIRRFFPQQQDRTGRTPATASGTDRASYISELQEKVRRLQQEILTLSNREAGSSEAPARSANSGGMAHLEAELNKAQQELARIQGRI